MHTLASRFGNILLPGGGGRDDNNSSSTPRSSNISYDELPVYYGGTIKQATKKLKKNIKIVGLVVF